MKLEYKIVSTKDVLDGIIHMIQPAMEQKHLQFEVINENAELDWYIKLDEVRFKQIFINLLSNAMKFTPSGGKIQFRFGCNGRDGMISHDYIKVIDNGIGMSKEFIDEQLFEPFSQENNEVTTTYVGSGLGLSIVKSLIDLMGGKIEVESEVGKGTTFTVFLDFERVDGLEVREKKQKYQYKMIDIKRQLQNKKILLVEDHPLNREIAKKLLENVGCLVDTASNGEIGVSMFETSDLMEYGTILMDIRMPVLDGLVATKKIRKMERKDAKTIPILAMTANAYEEDVKRSLDAGMNMHLAKPIEPQKLYEGICICLEKIERI